MKRAVLRAGAFAVLLLPGASITVVAQAPDDPINIYRFILDTDVPEPAALVAMGRAPAHVLRASAPKPLAASVGAAHARVLPLLSARRRGPEPPELPLDDHLGPYSPRHHQDHHVPRRGLGPG